MTLRINRYTLFFLLFFALFFPGDRFILHEPSLIWKLEKQNPVPAVLSDFDRSRLGRLKKNHFFHNGVLTFFSNSSAVISSHGVPPGYLYTAGSGRSGAVLYSNGKDRIFFIHRQKGRTWDFKTYAYPFMTQNDNIIFLITGENGGYGVLDREGAELASPVSSGLFVTTFDLAEKADLVFIGYANGYAKLFDSRLKELWFKKFLDSDIQITKKVSASPDGRFFAVLAGSENEYLYLLDRQGDVLMKRATRENRKRSIDLLFSRNGKILLEESAAGFRVYSTKYRKLIFEKTLHAPAPERRILCMDAAPDGNFILISRRLEHGTASVCLYDARGVLLTRLLFENEIPCAVFSSEGKNFQVETSNGLYLYGY